ncbi:MAG: 3-hydroxyanthranilate 3,4-dioxygenase [Cyanobacteria bacterium REEB65]|nr:3-hydroxyanthranilate 3,4-dioxygenase [Cyanobacteria bacterium REEB65]
MPLAPIDFQTWIEEHRHLLEPPVGNAQIWKDLEFIVMVVGGPNARKDYHVDPSDEFFYQLEGDIVLQIIDDGQLRSIPLRQGQIFLLPGNVPHSPQRPAGTVGLVIERERKPDEEERFQWYCDQCGNLLRDVPCFISDITTQLKPIFDAFWASGDTRCKRCGAVLEPPQLARTP